MKEISSANPEYPVVRITDAALKAMGGDVRVDLDSLHALVRDDLGLQSDVAPRFHFYGRYPHSILSGTHIAGTRTAHIQLPESTRVHNTEGGSREHGARTTIIHESVHLVDSLDRPGRARREMIQRMGANAIAGAAAVAYYEAVDPTHPLAQTLIATGAVTLAMGAHLGYYFHLDPAEKRARAATNDELVGKYPNLITFPNIPKT